MSGWKPERSCDTCRKQCHHVPKNGCAWWESKEKTESSTGGWRDVFEHRPTPAAQVRTCMCMDKDTEMSEEINSYRASEVWAAVEKNPDCAPEQLVRFSDHEATLTARDSEIERLKATLNNPWNPSLCPICSRDASGKTIECCPTHSRIAGLELNCELRDREITELKATKDDIILGLESKVERLQISLNASRQDKDRQLAARDQTISEQQTFINEDARKIAEQAKRIEEQNTQIDAWRTHIERLNKDVSLADLVVSDKNKRFAGLEAKLHILIGASGSAVEVLDDCGCDVEAGRLQNAVNAALSSDQPSHEQPPTDHFEDAKRTIASWPQWKRDVFSRDLADPQPFAEEKGKCVRCGHGPCFYNKVMAEPTGTVEKKE